MRFTIIIILLSNLIACGSAVKFNGNYENTTTHYSEEGDIERVEHIKSSGESSFPKNTENVNDWWVNRDGISIGGFSTWEIDLVLEQTGIFYYGAIGLVILAALAIWWKQYILAGALGVGAALLGFAPSLIEKLQGFIIPVTLLLIASGLFYVFGKYIMEWDFKKKARKAYAKLKGEGKDNEAVAALRTGDKEVDKEYRRRQTVKGQ